MSNEKKLDKNKKAGYEIKETPLLKKIFNKILGPIRFFQKKKKSLPTISRLKVFY